jgi:hypothetical protein
MWAGSWQTLSDDCSLGGAIHVDRLSLRGCVIEGTDFSIFLHGLQLTVFEALIFF